MNKRFLFFILLLFAATGAGAQKRFQYVDSSVMYDKDSVEESLIRSGDEKTEGKAEEKTGDDIQGDTGVSLRTVSISGDSLDAWKNKKEFLYARNLDSLLRAKNKEKEKATEGDQSIYQPKANATNMDSLFAAGWIKAVLWILAGLFVVYILYQLFLNKGSFRRSATERKVAETAPTPDEVVMLSNFDQLIHQSCKLGDYRSATRYLFLKTLQRLSERSLITFSIDKTNSRYVFELPQAKREGFIPLVNIYEFLWYGNNTADKDSYTAIESNFNNFLNKI
jgi:hypothetical protein